jgi:hypothetical protein
MWQKQELCVVKFGKVPIFPFNIFLDPTYHWTKVGNEKQLFNQLEEKSSSNNLKCWILKRNEKC